MNVFKALFVISHVRKRMSLSSRATTSKRSVWYHVHMLHLDVVEPVDTSLSRSSRIFLRDLPMRALKALLPFHRLHFHITILCSTSQPCLVSTLSAKPLVTALILLLEMHVRRRSWSAKHSKPVPEQVALSERSMSISLLKSS